MRLMLKMRVPAAESAAFCAPFKSWKSTEGEKSPLFSAPLLAALLLLKKPPATVQNIN